jgi:hypothetical protein
MNTLRGRIFQLLNFKAPLTFDEIKSEELIQYVYGRSHNTA